MTVLLVEIWGAQEELQDKMMNLSVDMLEVLSDVPVELALYKYGPRFQERGGSCTYMGLDEMVKDKTTESKGAW